MSDVKTAPEGLDVVSVLDAKGLSCPMPLLRTKKKSAKSTAVRFCRSTEPIRVHVTISPDGAPVQVTSTLVRKKNQDILAFSFRKVDL